MKEAEKKESLFRPLSHFFLLSLSIQQIVTMLAQMIAVITIAVMFMCLHPLSYTALEVASMQNTLLWKKVHQNAISHQYAIQLHILAFLSDIRFLLPMRHALSNTAPLHTLPAIYLQQESNVLYVRLLAVCS